MWDKASAEFVGHLEGDTGIVDAARVSFAKRADQFTAEENAKLLRYLFTHNHWSPYGHPRIGYMVPLMGMERERILLFGNMAGMNFGKLHFKRYSLIVASLWSWYENLRWFPRDIADAIRLQLRKEFPIAGPLLLQEPSLATSAAEYGATAVVPHITAFDDDISNANLIHASFRMKTSIFVARQAVKHQIHLCWNEVSRRYVDDTPTFLQVDQFRLRPDKSRKQGSGEDLDFSSNAFAYGAYAQACQSATRTYHDLLNIYHVAPEQARAVLPVGMMTEWIWTGTLEAWHRVCKLRLDAHAQKEIRDIAEPIDAALRAKYPRAWQQLRDQRAPELG